MQCQKTGKKVENFMKTFKEGLYIIAEVANAAQGVTEDNHRIIEAVSKTGADAIKFQFYKYDELATPSFDKYDNFQRTFYTEEDRRAFVYNAKDHGLDAVVDIFDRWGLDVASKAIDKIDAIKIPPAIIMDNELVREILSFNKPIFLGVGGYGNEDVDLVLSKLSGYNAPVVLLHGFQGFPTDEKDSSLKRVTYLKEKYQLPVGYADHISAESDMALRIPEYAFFAGATVIEKHVTLDREEKGLDYYSSLIPSEFKEMVTNLRRCQNIMGEETITSSEKDYFKNATRITTVREIKDGEIIFRKDIKFRRTENNSAMLPNKWRSDRPFVAIKDIVKDAGVTETDVRQARIGNFVGCRMHSTRLPKKALLDINGRPSIERCLINAKASKLTDMTVLATSTHKDDGVLAGHTLGGEIKFFRGAETDLVARILDTATEFGLDIIVRVTGDRPLISYELIDYLIESHLREGAEFSCFKNVPLGINPEVINVSALKRLKELVNTEEHSEYLTTFFKNNPNHFQINEIEPPEEFRHPQYRLVLDHPEDLEMFREIYKRLDIKDEPVSLSKVFDLLSKDPSVATINSNIKPRYVDNEFAEYLEKITKIETRKSA